MFANINIYFIINKNEPIALVNLIYIYKQWDLIHTKIKINQ